MEHLKSLLAAGDTHSLHMDFSKGLLKTWQLAFPRVRREREKVDQNRSHSLFITKSQQ
jgi:hypothetical protein